MLAVLQQCIKISRPLLRLLPKDFKTGIKKLLRYNINTPDYWDAIWEREGLETWRDYANKYQYILSQVPTQGHVLDIGCGVGKLLQKLKEINPALNLTGTDISAVAVDLLKQQGITGLVGGFPSLPLPSDGYDVILATEVLEHLGDPAAAVAETVRLCRTGGRVILTVPDDCLGPDVEVQHLHQFTRDSYTALLSPYFEHIEMVSLPDLNHHFLVAVCDGPRKPAV